MVEMVFRTEDGKIFGTKTEAEDWENNSKKINAIQEYFKTLFDTKCKFDYDLEDYIVCFDDIAKHIATNFDDLKNIMESK